MLDSNVDNNAVNHANKAIKQLFFFLGTKIFFVAFTSTFNLSKYVLKVTLDTVLRSGIIY
jgi:hypothetical protein